MTRTEDSRRLRGSDHEDCSWGIGGVKSLQPDDLETVCLTERFFLRVRAGGSRRIENGKTRTKKDPDINITVAGIATYKTSQGYEG